MNHDHVDPTFAKLFETIFGGGVVARGREGSRSNCASGQPATSDEPQVGILPASAISRAEVSESVQRAQDEQTRLNTETIEKAFQAQEEAGE